MDQFLSDYPRSHYRGSHIFSFIAKKVGLPVDQFNFFLAEILALIFAMCFRHYLPPKPSNLIKRHLIGKSFLTIQNSYSFDSFSKSSWYCSWSILFWFTDLAFNSPIMYLIFNALYSSTKAFL